MESGSYQIEPPRSGLVPRNRFLNAINLPSKCSIAEAEDLHLGRQQTHGSEGGAEVEYDEGASRLLRRQMIYQSYSSKP